MTAPVWSPRWATAEPRRARRRTTGPSWCTRVVCVSGNPVSRTAGEGGEGLAASDSVIEALLAMMETDYRGALRTMISTANPDLDEDGGARPRERQRRAVSPGGGRAPHARRGSRTRRSSRRGRWATGSGSSRTARTRGSSRRSQRTAELLPEAHVEAVENGAVSRPDIAASYISALTGVATPSREGRTREARPFSPDRRGLAADRPVAAAAARQQHRGAAVLLALGSTCRVALAADARPGPVRELVLAAVGATASDRARVAVRLAGRDALQASRARPASGRRACRAGRRARSGCACRASGSRAPGRGRTSAAGPARAPCAPCGRRARRPGGSAAS